MSFQRRMIALITNDSKRRVRRSACGKKERFFVDLCASRGARARATVFLERPERSGGGRVRKGFNVSDQRERHALRVANVNEAAVRGAFLISSCVKFLFSVSITIKVYWNNESSLRKLSDN